MNIKRYLLYLLIFIVVGAIGVSIYFAIRDKNGEDIAVEQIEETIIEESDDLIPEEDSEPIEEPDEKIEIIEDYYTSTSGDFKQYGFVCPEEWTLEEEDGGSRVILKKIQENPDTVETIMVLVEKKDNFKSTDEPEEMIKNYLLLSEESSVNGELIEGQSIEIGEADAEIIGYLYRSSLTDNGKDNNSDDQIETGSYHDEIDMLTYLSDGDHVYMMKYMSSGIDVLPAQNTFKDFLSTFTFESSIPANKTEDSSPSMNILILGVDSGMGREWGRNSARSDINIILHINLETHKATIVTVPRDLWVPIKGHSDGKINGAHAIGGPELAIDTFENFSGLEIDNYIITDFDGFIPLIDFLGGVTIEVNEDLADGFSGSYLNKGVHHLDGQQTLALCRNRHRSGDGTTQGGAWAREREAAKVIKALYEQKTTFEKIIALPAFANFLLRYTWTDLDFVDVLKLIPVLGNIDSNDISLRGVPSYSQAIGKASAVVHYEDETEQLFEEIKNQ